MVEERLLGTTALDKSGASTTTIIPAEAAEDHFRGVDHLAWAIDKDGYIYVVPVSKVGIKGT